MWRIRNSSRKSNDNLHAWYRVWRMCHTTKDYRIVQILGLWSLEERRIRSDLIEVYKMIHKLSNVNFEIFFVFDTNRSTRGHSLKLKKKRFNTELRQHLFTDRTINLWNSLDEQIVSSTSLNCFKNELEKLRKQQKLMGHAQSCFGYWSPEAEPVPPLVRPRPGELPGELGETWSAVETPEA